MSLPPSTPFSIPSLETINRYSPDHRIALYVQCDEEVRGRFLVQGKVLHTLGDEGEKLLKEAGIKPSSLGNARYAQLALSLADGKRKIHPGGTGKKVKPVLFTEEIYDALTLDQCVLLAYGSTYRGSARVVQHRPAPETFEAILKLPEWDQELESYFAHGATREMHAAALAVAEQRAKDAQAMNDAARELQASQAPPPAIPVPPAPVIVSAPPAAPEGTPEPAPAPALPAEVTNVVPFPGTAGLTEVSDQLGDHSEVDNTDDHVSDEDIGITASEWQEHFEQLQALSRQFSPHVTAEDRAEMVSQLRELAEEVEATLAELAQVAA
ncbi:hypothetical protein [Verrucomicrobium sp. BvORR034]|uniref:hypothetical protein n=1 Tax=Verrucomicrobium sp. BvORR034 TaxID=1396418 RepID=UPI002240FC40|nr:hypothetical protein [Verrucomicrobium sp. BvORR034]